MTTYIDLESISDLHTLVHYAPPKHPLISVIDHMDFYAQRPMGEQLYRFGFYTVSCKRFEGLLRYGKSHYDFKHGSLLFTAPGQVIGSGSNVTVDEGWALFVHPDLLHGSSLASRMHEYSFFNYDANEALHVSDAEAALLKDCVDKIDRECSLPIDRHTRRVLISTVELLLNYCSRFYDRQFFTREKVNTDVVQRFERLLKDYFAQDSLVEAGMPAVGYFASQLHLSASYLSDLLQKSTGKSTVEHIHLELVEKAKSLLWGTDSMISEIAYELGFEHPSHFTKLFKTKTGKSPKEYRSGN